MLSKLWPMLWLYWLFSFERYNGILGKFHTNQVSIEIQLMKKFIDNMHIKSLASNHGLTIDHEYYGLFNTFLGITKYADTASETLYGQSSLPSSINFSTSFTISSEMFLLHWISLKPTLATLCSSEI